MNTQTQEALKMAIGKLVLEKMTSGNDVPVSRCTITNVEIHALSKESLEQPTQEPVLPFQRWSKEGEIINQEGFDKLNNTHPYQWQRLTDDEIVAKVFENDNLLARILYLDNVSKALKQALKDKNT